ncbi:hypothetical protein BDR03DRAFT_988104 [Suillus americanus]|nr:hypothetical protein BDR03DRAFT_988104 [Suillus americanus]
MSCLMSLFSSDDPVPEVVELHPLHKLCSATTHTYLPANAMLAGIDHNDCCPSAITHTYPLQPALSSNEESAIELDNSWQSAHRPNKVFLKEVDRSSKLREDVLTSNARESQMQSAIAQHQQQNQSLQHDSANALTSLDENHHKEVAELQNNMVLDRQKAQTEARAEIEHFLAEKQSRFEHEMCLGRDRLLANNESELTRLDAKYSSKINSLDNQIRHANALSPVLTPAWRHFVGKKPVATCTNIVGFSLIPGSSSKSDADEEPQTDSRPSLTSLLGDVPITNATEPLQ